MTEWLRLKRRGRIGGAAGYEEAPINYVKVRNVVTLAPRVGDRLYRSLNSESSEVVPGNRTGS